MQIRPGDRSAIIVTTLVLSLMLAACASGSGASDPGASGPGPSDAPDAPPASQAGSGTSPAAAASTAPEPPSGGGQDGSNIDWATVDLTTIDWTALDLKTIDWRAIEDNPTAENLSEEDVAIIQARLDPGSATVTLGDETYEAESFLCASGHENTESDVFSFTSYTMAELGGLPVRVAFDVWDASGTGQTVFGDEVDYEMEITHVEYADPELSWTMTRADSVSIEGRSVSVTGSFDDLLTEGVIEEVPGSLTGECGDTSRF